MFFPVFPTLGVQNLFFPGRYLPVNTTVKTGYRPKPSNPVLEILRDWWALKWKYIHGDLFLSHHWLDEWLSTSKASKSPPSHQVTRLSHWWYFRGQKGCSKDPKLPPKLPLGHGHVIGFKRSADAIVSSVRVSPLGRPLSLDDMAAALVCHCGQERVCSSWYMVISGLILGLRPANEIRRYFVTTSLIGWAQA